MSALVHHVATGVVDLAGWMVWVVAIARVARTPSRQFVHGWWTKSGRLAVAVCFYGVVGGIFVPYGAVLILVGLRRRGRQSPPLDLAPPRGPQLPD